MACSSRKFGMSSMKCTNHRSAFNNQISHSEILMPKRFLHSTIKQTFRPSRPRLLSFLPTGLLKQLGLKQRRLKWSFPLPGWILLSTITSLNSSPAALKREHCTKTPNESCVNIGSVCDYDRISFASNARPSKWAPMMIMISGMT